jgi:large subunit ribosomal protein L10
MAARVARSPRIRKRAQEEVSTISTARTLSHRPPKPQKVEQVAQLARLLETSNGAILTDYRGLTVAEITDLRRRLQQVGAEYHVVKNTLFKIACGQRAELLERYLEGPVAVAFALEDPVAPAKTIFDFIREKRKAEVKAALIDGTVYVAEGIRQLSQLPSRQVLIGQVLGAIQAPVYNLVGTLQGIINNFVWTIQAIHDQKAGAGS